MTRSVRVQAPVRVLDAGGWTDTWFAGRGTVCQLAVEPGAEVSVRLRRSSSGRRGGVVELHVPAFGDRYRFELDEAPGHHPLLETALRRWAPRGCSIEVKVDSPVPPGSGLGTSASVTVAIITALRAVADASPEPGAVVSSAHVLETVDVGLQSGIQDQIAAAYGGANLITIDPYPQFRVQTLELTPATWEELTRRIVTVYLGVPHRSSSVHQSVIGRLTGIDAEMLLAPLRTAARDAADALVRGDLDGYGEAMITNTEAQASLHPDLVHSRALEVIGVARRYGAAGWKVNGAGGEGGTVTIVGPADPIALVGALGAIPGSAVLPLRPARRGALVMDQA